MVQVSHPVNDQIKEDLAERLHGLERWLDRRQVDRLAQLIEVDMENAQHEIELMENELGFMLDGREIEKERLYDEII